MVIPPLPQWGISSDDVQTQNALWEKQERLYTKLALEPEVERQQVVLEQLDGTYREVADHGWQAEWERRSYAMPDEPFRQPTIQESFGGGAGVAVEEPQLELELELH